MQSIAQSSDFWAFDCILFEIRAGNHFFPTFINISSSNTPWEIEDTLGSYPSDLPNPDCDRYANVSRKSKVLDELVKERIGQLVAKINVKPDANAKGIITETWGLKEARNIFAQTCPYINLDLNLFWKPKSTMQFMYMDMLIRIYDKIKDKVEMWKREKPLSKISSKEAD